MINDLPLPEIPELVRMKFYNLLGELSIKKLPCYLYIFNYACEEFQKYIFYEEAER